MVSPLWFPIQGNYCLPLLCLQGVKVASWWVGVEAFALVSVLLEWSRMAEWYLCLSLPSGASTPPSGGSIFVWLFVLGQTRSVCRLNWAVDHCWHDRSRHPERGQAALWGHGPIVQKKKSPPVRPRLDSAWPSFHKGGAKKDLNKRWLQQRQIFFFFLFGVQRQTCTDQTVFSQQCAEWQTGAQKRQVQHSQSCKI